MRTDIGRIVRAEAGVTAALGLVGLVLVLLAACVVLALVAGAVWQTAHATPVPLPTP